MKDNKEHTYKIGSKELRINRNSILWKNKLLNSTMDIPSEIKYGVTSIDVDMFSIGTKYRIDLKDSEGRVFTISIKSYFGIGKNKKFNQYEEIINVIWNNFFSELFYRVISEWEQGKPQKVGKFEIDSNSLTRIEHIGQKKVKMSFDEMELLPRFDHLLINSKHDSNKYLRLYYLEDWNWHLVYDILERAKEIGTSNR